MELPDRDLTLPEATNYWATDRSNLVVCRDKAAALAGTRSYEKGLFAKKP